MERQDIKAVLDIGSNQIKVVFGHVNRDGKIEILHTEVTPSEGVLHGNVINIDKTAQSIKEALRAASETLDIQIERVTIGLKSAQVHGSNHRVSLSRTQEDEEIKQEDVNLLIKDIYRTVPQPGFEIIHVAPQDYTVDDHEKIKDPIGMGGVRLEGNFFVITAPKNTILNINKAVKRAGLEVDHIILTPFATNRSILTQEEKEAGVCLVDIGGGSVDVIIFHDSILRHVAVIPLGSQTITKDISHGCMLMTSQAEMLKTKFGCALEEQTHAAVVTIPGIRNRPEKKVYTPVLARIIEARLEEIIQLVQSEIVASGYYNQLTAGVVLTGGGAQLHMIEKMFEYIIGYDTRIGYPCEYLVNSASCPQDTAFATSIGLLLSPKTHLSYYEYYDINDPKKEIALGQKKPEKPAARKKTGFFRSIARFFRGRKNNKT